MLIAAVTARLLAVYLDHGILGENVFLRNGYLKAQVVVLAVQEHVGGCHIEIVITIIYIHDGCGIFRGIGRGNGRRRRRADHGRFNREVNLGQRRSVDRLDLHRLLRSTSDPEIGLRLSGVVDSNVAGYDLPILEYLALGGLVCLKVNAHATPLGDRCGTLLIAVCRTARHRDRHEEVEIIGSVGSIHAVDIDRSVSVKFISIGDHIRIGEIQSIRRAVLIYVLSGQLRIGIFRHLNFQIFVAVLRRLLGDQNEGGMVARYGGFHGEVQLGQDFNLLIDRPDHHVLRRHGKVGNPRQPLSGNQYNVAALDLPAHKGVALFGVVCLDGDRIADVSRGRASISESIHPNLARIDGKGNGVIHVIVDGLDGHVARAVHRKRGSRSRGVGHGTSADGPLLKGRACKGIRGDGQHVAHLGGGGLGIVLGHRGQRSRHIVVDQLVDGRNGDVRGYAGQGSDRGGLVLHGAGTRNHPFREGVARSRRICLQGNGILDRSLHNGHAAHVGRAVRHVDRIGDRGVHGPNRYVLGADGKGSGGVAAVRQSHTAVNHRPIHELIARFGGISGDGNGFSGEASGHVSRTVLNRNEAIVLEARLGHNCHTGHDKGRGRSVFIRRDDRAVVDAPAFKQLIFIGLVGLERNRCALDGAGHVGRTVLNVHREFIGVGRARRILADGADLKVLLGQSLGVTSFAFIEKF